MKYTRFFPLLFIAAVALFVGFYIFNLEPVNPKNNQDIVFVVNPGEGISSISKRLESEHLIRNRYVFYLEVKRLNLEKQVQAGDFRLKQSMGTDEIAKNLTFGMLDVWVQIIEGVRSEEIAAQLKDKFEGYNASWATKLKEQEGYLFPDTYLIPKNADITDITNLLTSTFAKRTATLKAQPNKNGLSFSQSVILASIVEREAPGNETDRKLVAAVLLNRYKLGMPLQADATVQYALGYSQAEKTWWRKNVTQTDLQLNSPYNTYKVAGLPPFPIANPGITALTAVINPTQTDYLYYITGSDGKMYYARTFEEHNQNIARHL